MLANNSFSFTTFEQQETIKASEVNSNFSEIKGIFSARNAPLSFHEFESGDIVDKSILEEQFSKVRSLGVEVTPLASSMIIAEELNTSFQQMLVGANSFDDMPLVSNMSISLNEDAISINPLNYVNAVGATTAQIMSPVQNGSLVLNGLSVTYTPAENYFGSDSFTYRIFDGVNYSALAIASITVLPINDIPVATDQSQTTLEDNAVNLTLTATDSDLDTLTYEISTAPTNGVVVLNGTVVTYTPNSNYFGPDSFSFVAKDAVSQSVPALVSLTVSPVNDMPLAQAQTLGVVEDTSKSLTLAGSDIEGSALTYIITQQPSSGIISGTAPNLTYTPSYDFTGSVTLRYKVRDGALDSDEVTVTLTNNLLNKDYINERIAALETKFRNKSYNITLPRVAAEPVTVADINAVSSVINPLALTETTSALISDPDLTTTALNAAFAKHTNIRLHCTNITNCYANKVAYNKAIYGTNILTVQNNFLWDTANSRYLGTKCNAWYSASELSWVDKILDASKTNLWNGTYAFNSTANSVSTVFNQVAPTCGTVYYAYNQGCRSYGYAYVYIGGVQYPGSSMGNGGCASGSGTASVGKGQSVYINSHYYASGTVRTGY